MGTLIWVILAAAAVAAGVGVYLQRQKEADEKAFSEPPPKVRDKPTPPESDAGDQQDEAPEDRPRDARISQVAILASELAETAEKIEQDQRELERFVYNEHIADLTAAVDAVDWPEVVADYSDATLRLVEEQGTNIQFKREHREMMYRAVKDEIRKRAKGNAPAGHGMDEAGRQK